MAQKFLIYLLPFSSYLQLKFFVFTVNPRYNVDFGASQKSMLYQNLCYIEVYLKYKEKNRICKGNSLISLNEKIITY